MIPKKSQDTEFHKIIEEIINNERVQEMKNYRQHCHTSCYEHCYEVAYYCYYICKKMNLDYKSSAIAGMLHDFFLYDWRKKSKENKPFHAFRHGKIACKKAIEEFNLNEKEKDMIIKHMFPVTIIPPKSKEGWILTLVDKYCTLKETGLYLKEVVINSLRKVSLTK